MLVTIKRSVAMPGFGNSGIESEAKPHRVAVDAAVLLAGMKETLIRHGTETYRLRVTRQNRLILTK